MSLVQLVSKDVKFDRYGDISFIGNDIDFIDDFGDILYQNIIHRIVANFGDYKFDPSLGADLSSFIGKPVNSDTEESIRNRIIFALTSDSFLDKNEFQIYTVSGNSKILLRISVNLGMQNNIIEKLTINSIFHTNSGLYYATRS